MQKVSATIITFNEEKKIKKCLDSLSWVDEIVVVDSYSSDSTVSICRDHSSSVYLEKWQGYGRQKNLCASRCSHDIILNIDADEIVSATLQKEIQDLLRTNAPITRCRIPRKNYFNNTWIRYGSWYPDHTVRLYNKILCSFNENSVHESIIPALNSITLKGHLIHSTYSGLTDYFSRLNIYASLSAQDMIKQGKKFSWPNLLIRPPINFFKNYFLKLGFLDGFYGFMLAVGYSIYSAQKQALLWELGKIKKVKGDNNTGE